jgi:HlyD family secretion protein
MDAKKGDSASSGSVVATIVPKQRVAEISLNEIDIAKVDIGKKAILTFDAIDGLSIAGEVVEVDIIGTVTQGVVVYGVKTAFSSQDNRVKPGMSVSASIVTDVRQDVLAVPASAVKVSGNSSYVEVFASSSVPVADGQSFASAVLPSKQTIETGLSDDTNTEIISGLNEGDRVVVRTVAGTASSASQTTAASGLFGGSSAAGNSGNSALRMLR